MSGWSECKMHLISPRLDARMRIGRAWLCACSHIGILGHLGCSAKAFSSISAACTSSLTDPPAATCACTPRSHHRWPFVGSSRTARSYASSACVTLERSSASTGRNQSNTEHRARYSGSINEQSEEERGSEQGQSQLCQQHGARLGLFLRLLSASHRPAQSTRPARRPQSAAIQPPEGTSCEPFAGAPSDDELGRRFGPFSSLPSSCSQCSNM